MNRGKRYGIAAILTGVALAGMTACGTENGDGTERTEKTEIVESVTLETMIPESAEVLFHEEYHRHAGKSHGQEPLRMDSVTGLRRTVCNGSSRQIIRIHINHIR